MKIKLFLLYNLVKYIGLEVQNYADIPFWSMETDGLETVPDNYRM